MKIDLNQPVTVESARAALASFLQWWAVEILSVVPSRWGRHAALLFGVPQLRQQNGMWTVFLPNTTYALPIEAVANGGATADLIRGAGPVTMHLPESDLLRRDVRLPRAAAGKMRTAVALQVERLCPFRSEEVAFDCREDKSRSSADEVAIDVAIVPL